MTMTRSKRKSTRIGSLRELQKKMPRVLKALNANEPLALAAAANPLFALEALGYTLTEKAKREIERHTRFGAEGAAELTRLETAIFELTYKPFDLTNPEALHDTLEPLLRAESDVRKKSKKRKETQIAHVLDVLKQPHRPVQFESRDEPDPLEASSALHPVLPLLIAYRKLERSRFRFASREIFEQVLDNELSLPITKIRFKMQERSRRKGRGSP